MIQVNVRKLERLLLSGAFALLFILINGYQFNNGDQEEHLPYVYKLLNPSLYPNDYLVPKQISEFTVRYYFAHLLEIGGKFIKMDLLVFLIYFLCISITGYAISAIAEKKCNGSLAWRIAPFLIILVNGCTIGGNSILDVQLTCSLLAIAFCSIGLVYNEKDQPISAALFCGLAALFQFLIGIQLFILIMTLLLFPFIKGNLQKIFKATLIFMLVSAPMLFPLFKQQFGASNDGNEPFYHSILFLFRNPNHYVPSCFPLKDVIKTITWWSIILFSVYRARKSDSTSIPQLLFWTILGCAIYSLNFYFIGVAEITKLQWFKATIWPTLLGTTAVAGFLSNSVGEKLMLRKDYNFFWIFICTVSLVTILNSKYFPIEKYSHRYKIGNYSPSALERMHSWIRNNTSLNAVILPLPNDDSFLCEAQRSIPVGYKAIIHEKHFMLDWYQKMGDIYGVQMNDSLCNENVILRATNLYSSRPDSAIHSTIPIDFRIIDRSTTALLPIDSGIIIHQEGPYLLLKFYKNVDENVRSIN